MRTTPCPKTPVQSEDGWELVYKRFGFDNNDQSNGSRNLMYFILYNRYTSRLRLFAASASAIQAHNSASFRIGFTNNKKTAMFDILSENFTPLEEGKITGLYYTEGMEGLSASVSACIGIMRKFQLCMTLARVLWLKKMMIVI